MVEITTKELTEGNMGPSFIDTAVVGWFSREDSGELYVHFVFNILNFKYKNSVLNVLVKFCQFFFSVFSPRVLEIYGLTEVQFQSYFFLITCQTLHEKSH